MKVHIPTHLHDYSDGESELEAEGTTLDELLNDLDRRHKGIRFRVVDEQDRVRVHMRLFVNGAIARELSTPLQPTDEVHIVAALSGG